MGGPFVPPPSILITHMISNIGSFNRFMNQVLQNYIPLPIKEEE